MAQYSKTREQSEEKYNEYTCKNESHKENSPPFKRFLTADAKLAHIHKMHKCPMNKNTPPCFFATEKDSEMGKHIRLEHTKIKQKGACNLCSAPVGNEDLKIHQEQIHSKCPNCEKYFKDPASLKDHWSNKAELCHEKIELNNLKQNKQFKIPPETATLANLPNKVIGADGYMTVIMVKLIKSSEATPDEKKEMMEMLAIANLHNKQKQSISKNPYTAQSQITPLLDIPDFNHHQKEREINHIIEKATKTDLNPDTRARMNNWILMEKLNTKISSYVTQYLLTETSAVFVLINHLTDTLLINIESMLDRKPLDLSYYEIMSILQKQYFNVDLQALRDEVTQIKQMSNEKIQDFHGRVHHLCSLASKNFETQYRQIWVEQQVRDRIYKNLDQTNRIEIDTLETTHNVKMSSKEIVQTVIDRNNFRMNPIELEEDVLCNISRVNLQNELKLPLLERRSPTTYEVEKTDTEESSSEDEEQEERDEHEESEESEEQDEETNTESEEQDEGPNTDSEEQEERDDHEESEEPEEKDEETNTDSEESEECDEREESEENEEQEEIEDQEELEEPQDGN